MPKGGLEPPPSCEELILSQPRLPFRHFGLETRPGNKSTGAKFILPQGRPCVNSRDNRAARSTLSALTRLVPRSGLCRRCRATLVSATRHTQKRRGDRAHYGKPGVVNMLHS